MICNAPDVIVVCGLLRRDKAFIPTNKYFNMAKKSKLLKVGIVVAVLGALIDLSDVASGFPSPLDFLGKLIVFVAVLIIAVDVIYGRRNR
jgi:hypothetical protein